MSKTKTTPNIVHAAAMSGVDNKVNPLSAFCGATTGTLAGIGDYASVTCPDCLAALELLAVETPMLQKPRRSA